MKEENNDDYFEKQAGIELRRKVRLRCYDPNSDFAMLELKQKQGAQQMKRSLRVSREDAKLLKVIEGEDVEKMALEHESSARWMEGKAPKKVIVVPNKIVNIVI